MNQTKTFLDYNESFRDFKKYLEEFFLPWCGFQQEWLKKEELS